MNVPLKLFVLLVLKSQYISSLCLKSIEYFGKFQQKAALQAERITPFLQYQKRIRENSPLSTL